VTTDFGDHSFTIDAVLSDQGWGDNLLDEQDMSISDPMLYLVVPPTESLAQTWFAETSDPAGFLAWATPIVEPYSDGQPVTMNLTEIMDINRSLTDVVMIFLYGFLGLLTLIAVTTVISTVMTNIRLRARQFAVLRSVGMTRSDVRRMLTVESVLIGARALLWGIPIGSLAAYGIYRAVTTSFGFPYSYPWPTLVGCVIAVIVVMTITTRLASRWLTSTNIIDTIRSADR
jgi:putative ABC transport system permease protein